MKENLPDNGKIDIALQASMQLIPYVGSALAVVYFGSKQEKRFERIESFYEELADDIVSIKESIKPIAQQDAEALIAIIDSLHDKVELEPTLEKRRYFRNYFKSTLKHPVNNNYDERKYFLEALNNMSLLECEILAFIYSHSQKIRVDKIKKSGVDQYAILGAIGRLKYQGFIKAYQTGFVTNGEIDTSFLESVEISSHGNKFYSFCLED